MQLVGMQNLLLMATLFSDNALSRNRSRRGRSQRSKQCDLCYQNTISMRMDRYRCGKVTVGAAIVAAM